jgi:CheY-like chemotaxis protein
MKAHPDNKGLLIVMADGNIHDHDMVKKSARDCDVNHVFTSVYNGMQLMDLLLGRGAYAGSSHRMPDLIIMDIKLELIDGFEALKQIMLNPNTKDIPVYILTKEKKEADVDKAMKLGARDYFKKPLKFEELHALIGKICHVNFTKPQ